MSRSWKRQGWTLCRISGGTSPANASISDFQPPGLGETKFAFCKPSSLGYCAMTSLGHSHTIAVQSVSRV